MDERDSIVGNVYRKLMEIESRLLPCGLHIIGSPPTAMEVRGQLGGCTGGGARAWGNVCSLNFNLAPLVFSLMSTMPSAQRPHTAPV